MKFHTTSDLRQLFLESFQQQGHTIVPSSPLVPQNDPTLLFTNAGMVQFKDTFLGLQQQAYTRATSSQRCLRAGGKHNDLEQVGYTKRHHTFFEMLGNFSFGDYFKEEAIKFAWEFLTGTLGIPAQKLWVTVFHEDQETEDIWLNTIGVNPNRLSRCGEKDNFWSMGDTGPCGPCTEIFYDHGESIVGGPPGAPDEDGDRYVEIWNLVFMQYNRDVSGQLSPLPKPCVDTGMGLERIATVMQGVHDNYEIDLFRHLLAAVSEVTGCDDFDNKSMRVIADHIRSCCFLICDGVLPSNEGRGYVLRRIIRRAVRHGHKLGVKSTFFYQLVPALITVMGEAYPELSTNQVQLSQLLEQEEQLFSQTLAKGLRIFEQNIQTLSGQVIPGDVVFSLYDTYGFPPDLTADMAREKHLTLDYEGFERCMQKQREQSQSAAQFKLDEIKQLHIKQKSLFLGYDFMDADVVVKSLISDDNRPVAELTEGQKGIVVLNQTPFYAESGGQVGDQGLLVSNNVEFKVEDTKKHIDAILHFGHVVKGTLVPELALRATVSLHRDAIKKNHSATHLLHQALRQVLGEHVKQKGSLVDAHHLRFDFSHPNALSAAELSQIESIVNYQIRENNCLATEELTLEEAKASGAMALFGEKYDNTVRVVSMGSFSKEVCGGTHVSYTGDIGLFVIKHESAIASGVRRIEAMTGAVALQFIQEQRSLLQSASSHLKAKPQQLIDKIASMLQDQKQLQKQLSQLQQKLAMQAGQSLEDQAQMIDDIHVVAISVPNGNRDTMRSIVDQLKSKWEKAAIVLASVDEGKIALVAGVTKPILKHFTAGELLKQVAGQVGGKGGGRDQFAQGGGDQPENLPSALESVAQWIQGKLN